MSNFAKIQYKLEAFVKALDEMSADHYREKFPRLYENGQYPKYELNIGKKYIRVVTSEGSAYCFLDSEGNIYKPDGWKRPAKHIRGSIFDENFSIGKGLGVYGPVYLR